MDERQVHPSTNDKDHDPSLRRGPQLKRVPGPAPAEEPPSTVSCSSLEASSTHARSDGESVGARWGDGFNRDDTKQVRLEISRVSGTCSADKKWKLTVYGNKNP